ncbi:hypothetical protein [Microbacterium indicum]|uniref:hypothetical protein n=1 Tax=Microbacterium indicum TaxID=358100 RepID=UPI0004229EF9|nr:hypothetical protein [Microbacterium indicum]
MAMTLRLPDDLDAKLARVAEAEHTSKHAAAVSGIEEYVRHRLGMIEVDQGIDMILERDASLLKRLADA